jgi:hypothetical protein
MRQVILFRYPIPPTMWVYASPDYMHCVKAIIIKQSTKNNQT